MKLFEVEQTCLKLAFLSKQSPNIWRYSNKSWKILCFIYQVLVVLVTLYIIFSEFLFIYRNYYKIYEVTACAAPWIAHLLNLSKLYTLWYRNDKIHEVVDEFKQLVDKEKHPKYSKMLYGVNKRVQIGGYIFIFLYSALCLLYVVRPTIRNLFYIYVYKIEPIYEMPTISAYFFDETISPAYEISYFICFFCLISSGAIHFTSDTLFICCFLNICCQFDILSEMVNQNDLRTFLNHHKKIIKLTNEVNDLFKATVFCSYLLCGTLICVNGFQLVMEKDLGRLVIAAFFLVAANFTLFIYALGGQMIMDRSIQVCDQMYKIDKNYWLIIMNVQQPIKIQAGFFHACLPTYMSILNSAGSMITLLKSFV